MVLEIIQISDFFSITRNYSEKRQKNSFYEESRKSENIFTIEKNPSRSKDSACLECHCVISEMHSFRSQYNSDSFNH